MGSIKILVIGGSYGGLAAALNLLDLCNGKSMRFTPDAENAAAPVPVEIRIVDKRDGYYHLIGSALAFASPKAMQRSWVKYSACPALHVPGISYVQGSAMSIDPARKVAMIEDSVSGRKWEESYDFLVAASGLDRSWPTVPQSLTREAYLTEVGAHIEAVKNATRGVVVIGGGAVGVEMAAELKVVFPQLKTTLIHSRDRLLSSEPLPDEFKDRSLLVLRETGVEVIMNDRVTGVAEDVEPDGSKRFVLTLQDGSTMTTSHVIWALSKQLPTTSYLPKSVLDTEGQVKVSPTLNFLGDMPNHEFHYALGDLAAWSGIKRCGGAMHMGQVVATNIHQSILATRHGTTPLFEKLNAYPNVIALAVGKQAVMYSGQEYGTTWGVKPMQQMFGDDLGWTICWEYLGLGKGAGNEKVLQAQL